MEVNKAQDIRPENTPRFLLTLLQPKLQSEWNTSTKFVHECQYYKDHAKLSHSSQTLQEGTLTNTNPVILSLHFEWRSEGSKLCSNGVYSLLSLVSQPLQHLCQYYSCQQANLENLCPLYPGNKQTGDCFQLWRYQKTYRSSSGSK